MKYTKLLTLSLLIIGAVSLSACNTIDGAGKDLESAGESVQDAASR